MVFKNGGDSSFIPVVGTDVVSQYFARNSQQIAQSGVNIEQLANKVQNELAKFKPNSQSISTLGSSSGAKVVEYSNGLLGQVTAKDLGGFGDQLNDVLSLAKGLNVSSLVNGTNSKVPLIGGLIDKFFAKKDAVLNKYNTLSQQIEQLVKEMGIHKQRLSERINNLEKVYEYNREEYYNLQTFVMVGEITSEQLKQQLQIMKNQNTANDPMMSQQIADQQDVINRLDKRVHDLKTIMMVTVQTAPMIRMIQTNNQSLIDKFTNLNELTIPSWKKQFTLAIALIEQEQSVKLTQKIDDTTNDLMKRNAELLKQNTIHTAKAAQRSVVDIETLEFVQQTLISTVDEVRTIQQQGEQSRKDASEKMEQMKTQLITALGAK